MGALWGEDPRPGRFRKGGDPLKDRMRSVLVIAFMAHDRHGNRMPAYARYIARPENKCFSHTGESTVRPQIELPRCEPCPGVRRM